MTFFFDHDVPEDIVHILRRENHEIIVLREVLPVTATDADIFAYACSRRIMIVTCNRNHFLDLANRGEHPGLIILIRRRTRQDESAHLLKLIEKAGSEGLRGNINFA